MKLIVGLGNPGAKYQHNRHNVGFMFVDFLNKNQDLRLSTLDFHLFKPQKFMNKSGLEVKKVTKVYSLKSNDLIVVHDDLDIPLGKFRVHFGRGPQLHNGITSIENALGAKDFWRIRIGIDNRKPESWTDGEAYVLQDFMQNEKETVTKTFPEIFQRLKDLKMI